MSGSCLRIVMLGAPASGKGTLAKCIVQKYGCVHISPGDILRLNVLHKTKLGQAVKQYMDQGVLVPDDLVKHCVLTRILQAGRKSWILDGFPRTLSQAKNLQSSIGADTVDVVFNLLVPDAVIMERVCNRWIHLRSGRIYNKDFNAPKIFWKDDITDETLVQRSDDHSSVVKKRLQVYHASTQPVFDFFTRQKIDVLNLEGNSTDENWQLVERYLEKRLKIMNTS